MPESAPLSNQSSPMLTGAARDALHESMHEFDHSGRAAEAFLAAQDRDALADVVAKRMAWNAGVDDVWQTFLPEAISVVDALLGSK